MFNRIRKVIIAAFTSHPNSAGESYWQHLAFTAKMGIGLTVVGIIILIHGVFPFLFTRTASVRIEKLYTSMKERALRHQQDQMAREKLHTRKAHEGIAGDARIAIVGGGFSGVMVLATMVQRAKRPFTIEWYNDTDTLGVGLAYGTKLNRHLLNVPANRMGAFSGQPEGFYQWLCTAKGITRTARVWPGNDWSSTSFLPRLLYAEYLKHIMEECLNDAEGKGIQVNIHRSTVTDASLTSPVTQQMTLTAGHGAGASKILVDVMVLATGNLPSRTFGFLTGVIDPQVQLKYLPEDAEIVIFGTGLTMVDMLFTLLAKGYKGKITAISRNGTLPTAHQQCEEYPRGVWCVFPNQAPTTALGLLRGLRKEIKQAQAKGYDWRAVMDSLRPITQKLWQRLNIQEKRRFFSKLSPLWNLHCHRMPPEIHAEVAAMQEQGMLRIIAGMIYHVGAEKSRLTLSFRRRGQNTLETLHPALVINCTDPEYDIANCDHALIKNLRDKGLITVGALRVGIDLTSNGAAKGEASDVLYPIGPMLTGEYLESVAVPELHDVASKVAERVLRRVETISHPELQGDAMFKKWMYSL